MTIIRSRKAPAASTFVEVAPTNHFPVIGRWVYQDVWVRLEDGSLDLWSLPRYEIGGSL